MWRMPPPAVIHWVAPLAIDAAATVGVLVQERPVDDVGDGLEAAVRVPVGAPGLARRVVDLAHLVHVDERVEVGAVDAGEGPPDREALALEAARGGGDRADGTVVGLGPRHGDSLGRVSVSAVTAGMAPLLGSIIACATCATADDRGLFPARVGRTVSRRRHVRPGVAHPRPGVEQEHADHRNLRAEPLGTRRRAGPALRGHRGRRGQRARGEAVHRPLDARPPLGCGAQDAAHAGDRRGALRGGRVDGRCAEAPGLVPEPQGRSRREPAGRGRPARLHRPRVEGDEKAEWWARATEVWPSYDDYQAKTDRSIPLVVLDPK